MLLSVIEFVVNVCDLYVFCLSLCNIAVHAVSNQMKISAPIGAMGV